MAFRWLRLVLRIGVAVGGTALVPIANAESTPTVAPTVAEAPVPEECVTSPRSWDDLKRLIGVSEEAGDLPPLPTALPAGVPATTEEIVEIEAVVHELGACHNSGDPRRELAFYTDRYLGEIGPFSPEVFEGTSTAPLPEEDRLWIESVSSVERLDDGRIAAIVVLGNRVDADPEPGRTALYVFASINDRWMVDDVIEEIDLDGNVRSVASVLATPASE